MNRILGVCSCCGGPVMVPTEWAGVVPPKPTCHSCGAIAASHAPIIDMVRQAPVVPVYIPKTHKPHHPKVA